MGFINDLIKGVFQKAEPPQKQIVDNSTRPDLTSDIFKAYIPEFLYKPPFGYPRKANLPLIRDLAQTPYIFSVVKTLCDEVSSLEWGVRIKPDVDNPQKYEEKLKEIQKFFDNPNGNEESWEHIQRCLIRDILEVDAGILVKVFNREGRMQQVFARSGVLFLKNPDIYGYLGNREDFVMPMAELPGVSPQTSDYKVAMMNYYETYASQSAAYFQYGWTAGSYPTPFGKREVIYMMQNPTTDSIYGTSPVSVLADTIMTLYYGGRYHLDYYINSNIPEGIIQVPEAQDDELKALQERFNNKFKVDDPLGNTSRVGHKVPVTNLKDVAFIPFQLAPKELEILQQQEWFLKLVWMTFGVTPDELGITENSNRAISQEQTRVFKRKAIRPICNVLAYHINTQLLPEFIMDEYDDFTEALNNCPFEYYYEDYDVEEDKRKHEILQMELTMGIKTPEMVAEELDINVDELRKQKEEAIQRQRDMFNQQNPVPDSDNTDEESAGADKKEVEEKSLEDPTEEEISKELIQYIRDTEKAIERLTKEGA